MPFPFIGGKYVNFWSLCIYWFCSVAYLDYKWILTLGCTYQQQQSSYYFENHAWIYFCLCEQQPSNDCKPEIYAAFLAYIIYMYVSIHTFYVQNHYLFVCLFVVCLFVCLSWFPEKYTFFARTSTILQMVLWIWEFDAAKKLVSIFVCSH